MIKPKCQHCETEGFLVTGNKVYSHLKHLHHKWYWKCPRCGAIVGCHKGTKKPLGTMARKSLRRQRHKVHIELDKLWSNRRERKEAYQKLALGMGIPLVMCHVGMFSFDDCKKALKVIPTL